MKNLTHHKKYLVLIAPSSGNEGEFENCKDFDDALEVYNKLEDNMQGEDIHGFDTEKERLAFLTGYASAVGWLGDGYYALKTQEL